MPMAPPRACPVCGRLACMESHQPARLRGVTLQQLRFRLFRAQPFCVRCHVEVAVVRDHIVPLWAGGLDVESNTQALCKDCHDRKTADESRWRARGT